MPTKIKAVSKDVGKGGHKVGAFTQKGHPPSGASVGVVHKDFGPKGKSATVVKAPHSFRPFPAMIKETKKAKKA